MKKTLKIGKPFGRTLGWTSLIIFLLISVTEILLHFQFIQDILPYPSIGSGHHRLDFKVALLNKLIEKEGRVDCIFLGGSNVNAALDPEIFSKEFDHRLGEKLICFNFGIDGALMAASGYLAEILVKKYQPKSIIYGYNPIGFSTKFKKRTKNLILNNPWCSYHLGKFSLGGWLAEHSKTYGYFLRFRIWLEQNDYSKRLAKLQNDTTAYGFSRQDKIAAFNQNPRQTSRYRRILADFSISPEEIAGFEKILRLSSKTRVVIAEVPVYPKFQSYKNNIQNIQKIMTNILSRINHLKIMFIQQSQLIPIPPEGFRNIGHMNRRGANLYSHSLAAWIANAIQEDSH